MWWAVYDRDTRRYPCDHYDESPFVKVRRSKIPLSHPENEDAPYPHYGPIMVYSRRRFTRDEIRRIWLRSNRKCHLCGKGWKLHQRGAKGWHVDHVIPNIGGGRDTEMMENFLVACAPCNLKKGCGYTERSIREVLQSLFV